MCSFSILAIESSCDNSSLCLLNYNHHIVLYNNLNQEKMIEQYGGFIPNLLVDCQIKNFEHILKQLKLINIKELEYVAICCGPGIFMSLSIGFAVGCAIAKQYNSKIIYIDHIEAHIWSHIIDLREKYEDYNKHFISVILSGGHCLISYVYELGKMDILAKTVDDAPGEVFDKIAVALNLSPATGESIDKIAKNGKLITELVNTKQSKKRQNDKFYSMSFSGIKTRIKNYMKNNIYKKEDIAASLQELIYRELSIALKKSIYKILKNNSIKYLSFAGGVMANSYIKNKLQQDFHKYELLIVKQKYAQDNAVMIANLAILNIKQGRHNSHFCYQNHPYNKFIFNI
jgi:N6-L-threonylcarbamoyladenine synthase